MLHIIFCPGFFVMAEVQCNNFVYVVFLSLV